MFKLLRLNKWLRSNGFIDEFVFCDYIEKRARVNIEHLNLDKTMDLPSESKIGHYIYVLKLENLDVNGKQIEENGIPVYNWYVGETTNPITRWVSHTHTYSLTNKGLERFVELGPHRFLGSVRKNIKTKSGSKEVNSWIKIIPASAGRAEDAELLDSTTKESFNSLFGLSLDSMTLGCGSGWTKAHKPIEMVYLKNISSEIKDSPEQLPRTLRMRAENSLLKEFSKYIMYPEKTLRGGSYCRIDKAPGFLSDEDYDKESVDDSSSISEAFKSMDNEVEIINSLKDIEITPSDVSFQHKYSLQWFSQQVSRKSKAKRVSTVKEDFSALIKQILDDGVATLDGEIAVRAVVPGLSGNITFDEIWRNSTYPIKFIASKLHDFFLKWTSIDKSEKAIIAWLSRGGWLRSRKEYFASWHPPMPNLEGLNEEYCNSLLPVINVLVCAETSVSNSTEGHRGVQGHVGNIIKIIQDSLVDAGKYVRCKPTETSRRTRSCNTGMWDRKYQDLSSYLDFELEETYAKLGSIIDVDGSEFIVKKVKDYFDSLDTQESDAMATPDAPEEMATPVGDEPDRPTQSLEQNLDWQEFNFVVDQII